WAPRLRGRGRVGHDAQDGLDHVRVELRPGALTETLAGVRGGEARPVRTVRGHGVVGVAAKDDARIARALLAAQPVRIAEPVPALVTRADDRPHVSELLDRGEDA